MHRAREATARAQAQEAPGNGSLSPVTPIPYPTEPPATGWTPAWLQGPLGMTAGH